MTSTVTDTARDLTALERAVVAMLDKPDRTAAPWADLPARFVIKATESPADLLQAVYNAVDWDTITLHMEQRT